MFSFFKKIFKSNDSENNINNIINQEQQLNVENIEKKVETAVAETAVAEATVAEATNNQIHETVNTETITEPTKESFFSRLKKGLAKTNQQLTRLFVGVKIDEEFLTNLEEQLILTDVGIHATTQIIKQLKIVIKEQNLTESNDVKQALAVILTNILKKQEKILATENIVSGINNRQTQIWMMVGVNGAGKTTTIGKLSHWLLNHHKKVLLAAGDTFRAAAKEQLQVWGGRHELTVISQENGDPASVIFDATQSAIAKKYDIMIADTAGRLPTQKHLMEELSKIRRVLQKVAVNAPDETLLVIDGTTGQNALSQIKQFNEATPLSGLIVTKLDGSSKGGILLAIAHEFPQLPVYFIGVGEQAIDLQVFQAKEFVEALLSE
jgi:fused signal recognition particle receptor